MGDIGMFGCLALVIIIGVALFMSQRKGPLGVGPGRGVEGPARPQSDNPNVASGGSFGGPGGQSVGMQTPTYDNPNVVSGGSFGGAGGQSTGGPARPMYDNPNVTSGGSFGGGQSVGPQPGRTVGGSTGSSTGGYGGGNVPSPRDMDFDRNTQGQQPGTIGSVFSPGSQGGRSIESTQPGGRSLESTQPGGRSLEETRSLSDEDQQNNQPGRPSSDNPNIRSGGSFGG